MVNENKNQGNHLPWNCSSSVKSMMEKMGHTSGTGLGKNSQGIVQPVSCSKREKGVGLGYDIIPLPKKPDPYPTPLFKRGTKTEEGDVFHRLVDYDDDEEDDSSTQEIPLRLVDYQDDEEDDAEEKKPCCLVDYEDDEEEEKTNYEDDDADAEEKKKTSGSGL